MNDEIGAVRRDEVLTLIETPLRAQVDRGHRARGSVARGFRERVKPAGSVRKLSIEVL
jgi:hypothetical protein